LGGPPFKGAPMGKGYVALVKSASSKRGRGLLFCFEERGIDLVENLRTPTFDPEAIVDGNVAVP